ncbi:MAG: porin family protein [Gemmatimonas sp.]
MKRALLASAVLMSAISAVGSAQGSMVQIGAEVGASISKINGEGSDEFDSRTAPYIGATLIVQKPGSLLGFQTGLSFVQKGATIKETGLEGTFALNYVEVPLLLRISPFRNAKVVPSFLVGGTFGLNAACKTEIESGTVDASVDCDDPEVELEVKSYDFGITGGAEVAIPIGTRIMLAPTLRYTRGVVNIPDTDDASDKAKNSAFQFGVGFRIRM